MRFSIRAMPSHSPHLVTTGLDPVVHAAVKLANARWKALRKPRCRMDCRGFTVGLHSNTDAARVVAQWIGLNLVTIILAAPINYFSVR